MSMYVGESKHHSLVVIDKKEYKREDMTGKEELTEERETKVEGEDTDHHSRKEKRRENLQLRVYG